MISTFAQFRPAHDVRYDVTMGTLMSGFGGMWGEGGGGTWRGWGRGRRGGKVGEGALRP